MSDIEIVVTKDPLRLAAELIASAVSEGGEIALSGGSTPRPAYELATRLEHDWSDTRIWLGDERCVPANDDRANVRLVREALASVELRPEIRAVETHLPRTEAAADYDAALRGVALDFAFQGLGADGHTASLFPHASSLDETERLVVAADAGLEPWVDRVTMTVPMLSAAREVVFLALGDSKAEAARRAFAEQPSTATPASLVRSASGRTIAILDPAAARELST